MRKLLGDFIRRLVRRTGYDVVPYCGGRAKAVDVQRALRPEFQQIRFAGAALQTLLDEYQFETVLDIGCGAGEHSAAFLRYGKQVTGLDYGQSVYFEENRDRAKILIGDFVEMSFDRQFDCVWASHVLEHHRNVGLFLSKVFAVTKEGGVACITVPPMHQQLWGGHLSLWNEGLLLYNMVLAGFDCSAARVLRYGINISVIVRKKTAQLPPLVYDKGDVDRIAAFLPAGMRENCDGELVCVNW